MATVTSSPSSTGPTEEGSSSRTTSFPEFYSTDEGLRKLGTHLRSLHGVKVRSGIEHDKRVEYFKGKRLIECLLEAQNWPKTLPKITEKGMALELAATLLQKGFFHRSEKSTEKKGHLIISPKKVFEEMGYFTWMFSGNMMWSNVATVAVIVIVILFTLLPVWPQIAKKLLWYVAVTFLLFTVTFILLRFLMFLIMWIFGYEFWLFPRLFDESLGFVDSFKPIYVFDNGSPGQGYYRVALLVAIVSFIVWAARQPTEFDGFLQAQKEFVDDLYSGNLLTDYSQSAKDTLDRNKRVPDLEDLLRQIELDEIAAEATKSYKPSADTNDEEQQNQEEEEEMASGDDEGEDGDGWQEKDEEVEQDEDEDEEERE